MPQGDGGNRVSTELPTHCGSLLKRIKENNPRIFQPNTRQSQVRTSTVCDLNGSFTNHLKRSEIMPIHRFPVVTVKFIGPMPHVKHG